MQTGAITLASSGKPATFSPRLRLFHETKCSDDGADHWDLAVPTDTGHTETKDLRLIPGGTVSGIVRDAKTGEPIKNIYLRIRAADSEKRNFERGFANNNHGEFRETGLFPGKYFIERVDAGSEEKPLGEVIVSVGQEVQATLDWPTSP